MVTSPMRWLSDETGQPVVKTDVPGLSRVRSQAADVSYRRSIRTELDRAGDFGRRSQANEENTIIAVSPYEGRDAPGIFPSADPPKLGRWSNVNHHSGPLRFHSFGGRTPA
jgi:hypothetical protein